MVWAPFLIAGLLAFAVGALAIWRYLAGQRRKEAIQDMCRTRGYVYVEKDAQAHRRYRDFVPFDRGGSGRQGRNIVRGTYDDHAFEVLEYRYTVQHGKSSTTHTFRTAALKMPLRAPGLVVRPEHVGHKILDALGGEDIDFSSDAFSRRYWVQCSDRRFAYDVLHPALQERLLGHDDRMWQWHGDRLLIHDTGRLESRHIHPMLDELVAFRERLPRHLLADGPAR